jgi:hypothetical protein
VDLRPSIESAQGVFGLGAIVTIPDGDPVQATVFWLPSKTVEVPIGNDMVRAEERRVLVISRAEVPQVPRGTLIFVPEYDTGDERYWVVDAIDRTEGDHVRVLVKLAP